jgi:hypothetical protein
MVREVQAGQVDGVLDRGGTRIDGVLLAPAVTVVAEDGKTMRESRGAWKV